MDLDHLEKLISKIQLKDQSINSIAQYCILNSRGSENQIAKVIQKHFPQHYYSDKMLALLKLVSEIFVRTWWEKRDDRFFKPLAAKAKVYIEEIARRVKQLNKDHLKIVPDILSLWATPGRQLFAFSFMERLRKVAEPIIVASNKNEEEKKNNNSFQYYTKTFLVEYEDVKSYEPTSRIYDGFVNLERISNQMGQINTEMKKLGLETPTPEISLRAAELRRKLEKFSQKLQDIVCKIHVDYKTLREACREQFERLPAEARELLQKPEQQQP